MTARDIELFTELTGDRNPLHYDAERAAASPLRRHHRAGRRHLRACSTPWSRRTSPVRAACSSRSTGASSQPVRPGDTITAEVEVLAARDDKPIHRLRTTITNQDGTVVLDGTATVYRAAV